MLIVRVELKSAVTGETTELARMHISNAGGTNTLGNYDVQTLRGRCAEDLDRAWRNKSYTREGKVENHKRLAEHVWHLVGKALKNLGYGNNG